MVSVLLLRGRLRKGSRVSDKVFTLSTFTTKYISTR